MKRMLSQKLIDALHQLVVGGGDEWVNEMKELIGYDETSHQVVIEEFYANHLYIDDITKFINDDAETSFFPSLTDQAGKVVKVNSGEDGFEYGEAGTKLYKHTFSISDGEDTYTCIITSTRSTSYTNVNQLTDIVSVLPNDEYFFILNVDTLGIYYVNDMPEIGKLLWADMSDYEITDEVSSL